MSLKDIHGPIKVSPITRAWRPNLAFKLKSSAETKRWIHKFHRFKMYREHIGRPIQYYGDILASDKIKHLRRRVTVLQEILMDDLTNPSQRDMSWVVTEGM